MNIEPKIIVNEKQNQVKREERPYPWKNVGFIGAGKVGVTLGRYLQTRAEQESNLLHVSGYYSRTLAATQYAAQVTQSVPYEDLKTLVETSDILFFTLPDDEIAPMWKRIQSFSIKEKIFCHCSGVHSSTLFQDSTNFSSYSVAIHPLFAIASKEESYKHLHNAHFTLEGSVEIQPFWEEVFHQWGNPFTWIASEDKVKYHAAAVFASNLVLANLKIASDLLVDCGFTQESAQSALLPIALNNVENVAIGGLTLALTGPVQRGDVATVEKHLQALPPEERELYVRLSQRLVPMAKERNPSLSPELEKVLRNEGSSP